MTALPEHEASALPERHLLLWRNLPTTNDMIQPFSIYVMREHGLRTQQRLDCVAFFSRERPLEQRFERAVASRQANFIRQYALHGVALDVFIAACSPIKLMRRNRQHEFYEAPIAERIADFDTVTVGMEIFDGRLRRPSAENLQTPVSVQILCRFRTPVSFRFHDPTPSRLSQPRGFAGPSAQRVRASQS